MCKHIFNYLPDIRENYNPDGETLTGVCIHCGVKEKAYGMRWSRLMEEKLLWDSPFGAFLDNDRAIWCNKY